MAEIVRGVKVGDCSKVPVGFCPSVLGGVTLLANRAADKYLANAVVAPDLCERQCVRIDRYFDAIDVQRSGALGRLGVVGLPEVKLVGRPLKQFDYVDGALGVISCQGTTGGIIPSALKVCDGVGNDAVHACTVSQAFRDSPLGVLVLNDERSILSRIFRLPQDSHLAYRGRRNEIISKLRRGKSGIGPRGRRSSHG